MTEPSLLTTSSKKLWRSGRALWWSRTISFTGSAFSQLAIPLLTYKLSHSGWQVGIQYTLMAVGRLAATFATPRLRHWRSDRDGLVLLDVILGLSMLLPVIFFYRAPVLAICLCTLLTAFFSTLQGGLLDSLVGHFAAEEKSPEGIRAWLLGKIENGRNLGFLAGYALAYIVCERLGYRLAFVIDALSFLVSALLIGTLPNSRVRHEPATVPSPFKFLWQPRFRGLVSSQLFLGFGLFMYNGSFIVALKKQLHASDGQVTLYFVGQYLAGYAGSFVPTYWARRWGQALSDPLVLTARYLAALIFFAMGFVSSAWLFILLNGFIDFSYAATVPATTAFWHRRTAKSELRVMGASRLTAIFVSGALGSAVGAWMIDRYSFTWVFAALAAVLVLSNLILQRDLTKDKDLLQEAS